MSMVIDVAIPPLEKAYSYLLPPGLEQEVGIGFRVEVTLGKRKTSGFVIAKYSLSDEEEGVRPDSYKLKAIEPAPGNQACFHPGQLPFFRWMANYYCEPLANILDTAVPAALPLKVNRYVTLSEEQPANVRGKLQKEIVAYLNEQAGNLSYTELLKKYRGAGPALRRLQAGGLVKIEARQAQTEAFPAGAAPDWAKREVALDAGQAAAFSALQGPLDQEAFATFLLHGVTGSGKTEIYIEAIQHLLKQGKGALIIVPEIALTPQLIDRFTARLGSQIAVSHSGLSKRARWNSWQMLLEGKWRIAIGARSGIFAPVCNLGLIVVDEEHDGSYKQSDGLRYNARDLAVVRGKLEHCPVVLGSATPSLESFHNALQKKYTYLSLPARHVTASRVSLELIDLNLKKPWQMASKNVSPELHAALSEVLNQGEQAFILFNRRGFASYLQCEACQKVLECPNCSVTLTYHQKNHVLKCHYCNFQLVPPTYCPQCVQESLSRPKPPEQAAAEEAEPGKLIQRGSGTERVYEELLELFPGFCLDRLDSDSASDAKKYREILDRVRSGETKILVGTQMIAKGHDLPGVTLVGIVDCDVGLHMPDFRAGERVFQLLTQASGRAGRGAVPGRVILQTRVPLHPSLTKTLDKDFVGFAKLELANRQALNYPPYTRVLRIVASATEESSALKVLELFKKRIAELVSANRFSVAILGPCQAPLKKLRTHWRWHLLLKTKNPKCLHTILRDLHGIKGVPKGVRVAFDLDPQDLL